MWYRVDCGKHTKNVFNIKEARMEELGLMNILGEEDVERLGLFSDPEETTAEPEEQDSAE